MRRLSFLIAFLGMLALSIGSCSNEGDGSNTSGNSPSPVASQAAPQTTSKEKPFSKPALVPKKPTASPSPVKVASVSTLIQSTNPDERVRQVQKGRPDPFALVPVQPIVTIKPSEDGTEPSPATSPGNGTNQSPTSPGSGINQSPRPVPTVPSLPSASQPRPGVQPPATSSQPPRATILPPPPSVPRAIPRAAARPSSPSVQPQASKAPTAAQPQANNPSVSPATPRIVNVPRSPAPPKIVNVPRSPAPPKINAVPRSSVPSPRSYVSRSKVQAKTKNAPRRNVQPQSPGIGGLGSTVGKARSWYGSSMATTRVASIGALFVAASAANPSSSNQLKTLPRQSSGLKSGSGDGMVFKMEAVVGVTPASLAKANVVPRPSSRLAAAPKKPAQPPKKSAAKAKPPAKTTAKAKPPAKTTAKAKPPAKTTAKAKPPAKTTAKAKPPAKTTAKAKPPAKTTAKAKPPAKTTAKAKPPANASTAGRPKPVTRTNTAARPKPPAANRNVANGGSKVGATSAARPTQPTTARNAANTLSPATNAATPIVAPGATSAVGLGVQLGTPGVGSNSTLPTIPAPIFRPELPKLPEPELARAVAITGVVQIGDTTQAIVKAPNETSSRYVKAGDRISNGQVLIKRIDMNEGTFSNCCFGTVRD